MNLISSLNRHNLIGKLSSEEYDLLVIGGGITGAGIAMDAASRGIKTALVEKQDFAAGTSSRSTKLIHGGLRYLTQFEFRLVKEVGHERAVVHHLAPHLVIPEKILLPLTGNGTYGKRSTSIGLWLYDFLAGVKKEERRKMLSKKQTMIAEPLLDKNLLKGGCLYTEYRTDDARLTIEVLKTAAGYGADCANYTNAEDFIYENKKIAGVECNDLITGNKCAIKAKVIVNATGPWVDQIRERDHSLKGKRLHLTKGVHIVVPHVLLPIKQSIYFNTSDNRNLFAIPRGKTTYIGTTDTDYSGNLERPEVTGQDAAYLIDSANHMFPRINLTLQDIISCYAGIRPLIHEKGKTPSEISRKDEIFISDSGLISIAGGKLTGYRKMAEKIVNIVSDNLNKTFGYPKSRCKTESIILNGSDFEREDGLEIDKRIDRYILHVHDEVKIKGLGKYEAEYLVRNYGKHTDLILKKFSELNERDRKSVV